MRQPTAVTVNVAAATLAALALTGCSNDSGEPAARSTPRAAAPIDSGGPAPSTPAASPSPTVDPTRSLPSGEPGEPVDVVLGLGVPWDIAFLPDGAALVSLRDEARIVRVDAGGAVNDVPAPGAGGTVPGTAPGGEGGLLGLAVSPSFAQDGLVYAYTSTQEDNRVVRMVYDGASLGQPEPVVTGIPRAEVHNGGRITFGPDGMLWTTTGDARDTSRSQDPASLGGKVLRTTPDGAPAPDNPDPASPVFTLGHRNVQGLDFDAEGRPFASEFGQNTLDEMNALVPGGNYGWPDVEGAAGREGFIDPRAQWGTDEASPSGLAVTSDAVYVAGLRGERLWRIPLQTDGSTGEPVAYLQGRLGRIREVEVAPDGSLWLLTDNASRGQPREGDDRLVRVPLG